MTWSRHVKILVWTFAGLTSVLGLFVLAMNPYGNLPGTVFPRHVMMDINQRYQYPSVVRSGRYDSLVIGTSTSRLLDPAGFEKILGGRFANVAMNAGTAWEQTELTKLFLRHQKKPNALVVGIDWVWCARDADRERITFRGFPEWMYDADPWNDLAYMFNARSLEIAVRRGWTALSGQPPRLPENGFEVFTPPEKDYDLEKARIHIYGQAPRELPAPKAPPDVAPPETRSTWQFPALAWLEGLISDGKWRRVVLLLPPVHVKAQPRPGTLQAIEENECRARIATLAARHGASLVDFRIPSAITRRDDNYWDPLHYRIGIADRILQGLARALATGRSDPSGDWVMPLAKD